MAQQVETLPMKEKDRHEADRMFPSVWQRVVRGSSNSPIELETPSDAVCPAETTEADRAQAAPAAMPEATELAALEPAKPRTAPMPPDCAADDFPSRAAVPFLGCDSVGETGLLQELLRQETHNRHYYRSLARRVGGTPSRTLAALGVDCEKAARRLGAACFLISGMQPLPQARHEPRFPSYRGALRERFIEEQQAAARYISAAEETSDLCLRQLFGDLAREKLTHARILLQLVENIQV